MTAEELIRSWREILNGWPHPWVVFQQGTCVVLNAPSADPEAEALEILRIHGPVQPGTAHGDFGVGDPQRGSGKIVSSHHDSLLTFVAPSEIDDESDIAIGIYGRLKRAEDAENPVVVHVERPMPAPTDDA